MAKRSQPKDDGPRVRYKPTDRDPLGPYYKSEEFKKLTGPEQYDLKMWADHAHLHNGDLPGEVQADRVEMVKAAIERCTEVYTSGTERPNNDEFMG